MGIAWPSTLPEPQRSRFWVEDRNIANPAAFDFRSQIADRGQRWRGLVRWNHLRRADAFAIAGHLARARGSLFVVEVPIFEYDAMIGGQSGNLTLSGAHTAGSTTLTTTGFSGSSPFLAIGDKLRIAHNGERWLYEVVEAVTGGTTVNINPPTRHDYTDATTISTLAGGAEIHLSCFLAPGFTPPEFMLDLPQEVALPMTVEFVEALREDLLA